jgi:hypothetical protein
VNYLPWAGFEPWSFWSLPPRKLGLQAWATGAQLEMSFCLECSVRAVRAGPTSQSSASPWFQAWKLGKQSVVVELSSYYFHAVRMQLRKLLCSRDWTLWKGLRSQAPSTPSFGVRMRSCKYAVFVVINSVSNSELPSGPQVHCAHFLLMEFNLLRCTVQRFLVILPEFCHLSAQV